MFGDSNSQIKLRAKQKFKFLSATHVMWLVDIFGPPICSCIFCSMVYICLVSGIYVILISGKLLVFMFDKKQRRQMK